MLGDGKAIIPWRRWWWMADGPDREPGSYDNPQWRRGREAPRCCRHLGDDPTEAELMDPRAQMES